MKMISSLRYSLLTLAAAVGVAHSSFATGTPGAVDIEFDNFTGTKTGTIDDLGSYYSSSVMKFTDVATVGSLSVDLKVTATAWGTYSFKGHLPNYSENRGEPAGDLGLYYQANSYGSGGLNYTLEFYKGGTDFKTTINVSKFDLLIYDVDGEPGQSEAFRAFIADGLSSYRLAKNSNSVTASNFNGGVLFSGPGYNIDEEDASGAAILTYSNTSKITLAFESTTTYGNLPNGIFTAIDGDLSMLKGDDSGFGGAVKVPEPTGVILLGVAGAFSLLRRRRKQA